MLVCLSVNFFSVKDFSGTTLLKILKFGTNISYYKLYYYVINQVISYWLSYRSYEVSCIGLWPKAEDQYS